ncbi:hypothetical protein CYMTET_8856, partial [Cymbomonas tetramitiformis]
EYGFRGAGLQELAGGKRDAIFRAGVDGALKIAQEDEADPLEKYSPSRFVCSLAGDIGVPRARAITLVTAAVAARGRSKLLQALEMLREGKVKLATKEMQSLLRLFAQFPPITDSPEMEMVACDLKRFLTSSERSQLISIISDSEQWSDSAVSGMQQALGIK